MQEFSKNSKIKYAAVIGGGFYACYLACELAKSGVHVDLFERENSLMVRASYFNQARIHAGYHYPRHTPTALRSRLNYPRFVAEFSDCLDKNFKHIYAISRNNSKVSAKQFQHFMTRIGSPLKKVSDEDFKLFDDNLVEAAFYVDECAFNADLLREKMKLKLESLHVNVRLNAKVEKIIRKPEGKLALFFESEAEPKYDLLLNCTYCDLLNMNFTAKPSVLEYEIAELALVELPIALREFGFTFMCGPFFSTMPFPSTNYHSFSHVRYTPHLRWTSAERVDASQVLAEYSKKSRFEFMIRDAQKYLPALSQTKYIKSFFEVKTLLPQNSNNDGRPIFFEMDRDQPNFVSILGGKIDNVYDIADRIRGEFLS